jgi:hypothetical protein
MSATEIPNGLNRDGDAGLVAVLETVRHRDGRISRTANADVKMSR